MQTSMEHIVGYHCAPVIRGLKVANLVAVPNMYESEFAELVSAYNAQFNAKGLYFFTLCQCSQRRLLLVYRKTMLTQYVRRPSHRAFLERYGYDEKDSLVDWLYRLRQRLETGDGFPHEIGLFLGYPLEDVQGFIEHRGAHYELCGEWKVYGSAVSARRCFHCYQACRNFCHRKLTQGKSLHDLVAHTA